MNLIKEIEACANFEGNYDDDLVMRTWHFVDSPWWPRIKVALEAAQEMYDALESEGYNLMGQRKFREAMGK